MKATTSNNKKASNAHAQNPFFNKGHEENFLLGAQDPEQPFFNQASVHAKLTVGQPNDKYEQEAYNVADKVVQKLTNGNQQACKAENIHPSENQASSIGLQQKPIFESNEAKENTIQQKAKNAAPVLTVQKQAPQEDKLLEKEETGEEGSIQLFSMPMGNNAPKVQPSAKGPQVPDSIEPQLQGSKGKGNTLPSETRSGMESAFNADFSDVRVHTDSSAVEMNNKLNAQAFTNGNDIYFNEGKYNPGSGSGQHLLAHELTHTVQQGASGSVRQQIQRKG
ncbi:MAG: DUF4157 domain-containing protein [Bacteroidales bacterium]|nr:DUF4157 domain-containing protein [Bacteroidales bacterium]